MRFASFASVKAGIKISSPEPCRASGEVLEPFLPGRPDLRCASYATGVNKEAISTGFWPQKCVNCLCGEPAEHEPVIADTAPSQWKCGRKPSFGCVGRDH
jgi:hypothetical protein